MTAVNDILRQLPMDQLADRLGTDSQTVSALSAQLIPTLLGGLSANAADPAGERSLAAALNDHASSKLADGPDLNDVDTDDGQAIVHNIFGDNTNQVTRTLGDQVAGGNSELVQKLLKILAPIVLAYLAKQLTQGGSGAGNTGGGGILGDILGGLLGGGQQAPQQIPKQVPQEQQSSRGGLPDILLDALGGLLGQGRRV